MDPLKSPSGPLPMMAVYPAVDAVAGVIESAGPATPSRYSMATWVAVPVVEVSTGLSVNTA